MVKIKLEFTLLLEPLKQPSVFYSQKYAIFAVENLENRERYKKRK